MLRVHLPRPLRVALAFSLATLLLAIVARPARGEEALVLDNGAVLRGTVVREDATTLVFRLSGVGSDSKITIERSHVTQRFVTVDRKAWLAGSRVAASGGEELAAGPTPVAHVAEPAPAPAFAGRDLPEEEPEAHEESFLERTTRRASLAFPRDAGSRTLLASLAVVVLLCLVGLGGKMADLVGLTLGRNTLLALLLGAMIAADVAFGPSLLRADLAGVILPIELLAWTACAAVILKCGFGRAFQLLAFVLVAGALVTFSTGAVLVLV